MIDRDAHLRALRLRSLEPDLVPPELNTKLEDTTLLEAARKGALAWARIAHARARLANIEPGEVQR